jgi:hypothetical protein
MILIIISDLCKRLCDGRGMVSAFICSPTGCAALVIVKDVENAAMLYIASGPETCVNSIKTW